MPNQQHECSDEALLSILTGDDSSSDTDYLLERVENCATCRQRFEELTANPKEWHRARQMLIGLDSTGALRSRHNSTSHSTESRSDIESHTRNKRWAESMARQLLSPPSHPEMLGRIGRYEVERLIGSGGMGIVFKAIDTELNRPVAIKVLAPYLAGNGAARQRFAREAKAAAAVVHEHVVPIYNVESDGESPFLVMHYVSGESLQSRIDREGALELCEILRIGMQVASGLDAAHAQGLVHRDIKPSNILLERGVERSLITDFGLARAADDASLTNTGFHAGTPPYMSPEQARGDSVDWRSDLFSLGSLMYAICTGRPPFRAETAYGVLRKITDTEPRSIRELNPQIPEWLEDIVKQLMCKDVESRLSSADQVSKLLEECLAHVQRPTTNPLPSSLQKQTSKNPNATPQRVRWIVVCAGLLTVLSIVGLTWVGATWIGDISHSKGNSLTSNAAGNSEKQKASQNSIAEPVLRRGKQFAVAPDPSDKAREQLLKLVTLSGSSLPAEQVLVSIQQAIGVPVELNRDSLQESSIDPKQLISMHASGTAREHLRRVCKQLQLEYIVHEDNVEIASVEYAQNNPVLRLYDLSYVLPDSRNVASLIAGLETLIAPSAWLSNGGQCSISVVDSVLVIRATESMHLQIEQLLSRVNALHRSTTP
jgi:serine/threonine protein kinase